MKVSQLLDEWLYQNHCHAIKDNTILRYQCTINCHINPLMGEMNVEDITARDLQRIINEIKNNISERTNRHLSNSTINNIIAVLKLAFNYAVDFDIIDVNPTLKIHNFPVKREEAVKAFTKEEQIKIERYIDKLHNDEYFCYILVLYTGLRIGEMLALTWNDINLASGLINIDKTFFRFKEESGHWKYHVGSPKTDHSIRQIPIPSFLKEKLREIKRKKISKYVISKNDGSPLDDKLIVYRYKMLLRHARVRYLNFHCLRHTFATRALEAHMDIKTLSEILGHANAAITLNIYVHSLIDYKKQQMRKMKRLI